MNARKIPPSRSWAHAPTESECSNCTAEIAKGAPLVYAEAFDADFCSRKCFHAYSQMRSYDAELERLAEISSGGQI